MASDSWGLGPMVWLGWAPVGLEAGHKEKACMSETGENNLRERKHIAACTCRTSSIFTIEYFFEIRAAHSP